MKPRNYVVVGLLERRGGSGAHVKTNKAIRKQLRKEVQKELKEFFKERK